MSSTLQNFSMLQKFNEWSQFRIAVFWDQTPKNKKIWISNLLFKTINLKNTLSNHNFASYFSVHNLSSHCLNHIYLLRCASLERLNLILAHYSYTLFNVFMVFENYKTIDDNILPLKSLESRVSFKCTMP